MKRRIIDYEKLTTEVLDLLVEKFPDGYNYDDIMTFQNARGETVKAVEVRTDDTIYLVKIGVKLEQKMEDYSDEEMEDDVDTSEENDESEDDVVGKPTKRECDTGKSEAETSQCRNHTNTLKANHNRPANL